VGTGRDDLNYERTLSRIGLGLFLVSVPLLGLANYFVFLVVQSERNMGAVSRIFYFHVGSAIACYCAFAVVFFCSVAYLSSRHWLADRLNEAAAEVGFIFCTLTLASGMIWGRTAWNTWFRWEPRLVTFLLLWLIFLAFTVMRMFGDVRKLGAHSAVLGILGSFTVPLVWISVRLLPQSAQLHPQVLEQGGLQIPNAKFTLFLTMAGLVIFLFSLIFLRARIGILEEKQK
jgi:heme exporter protein C